MSYLAPPEIGRRRFILQSLPFGAGLVLGFPSHVDAAVAPRLLPNMDLAYNQKDHDAVYMRGRDLWEKIPDFSYTAPGVDWIVRRQGFSASLLLLWCCGAIAAASFFARRMRVD